MPPTDLVWTEAFVIRAYEVGPDGNASVLTLCDLLQEAAGEHARSAGREGFALPNGGWATWVLSRLGLEVDRLPRLRERIEIETWPASLDGLRATRDFRAYGDDGLEVARATSQWFLIDVDRRRPVRLPPSMDGFAALGRPRALVLEDEPHAPGSAEHRQTFAVRRSDLDRVGHANNVRFLEWMLESLPSADGLEGVDVRYRAEAVYGDRITVESGPALEGVRYHRVARASDDRTLALARTTWTL